VAEPESGFDRKGLPLPVGCFESSNSNQRYSDDDPNGLSFDDTTLRKVLLADKEAEVLLEMIMNVVLQAKITGHLGAEHVERTHDRQGYWNGTFRRQLAG
jgi:hypothetical protein